VRAGQERVRRSRRLHLTRVERSEVVKKRLFAAAVKVVGEVGYAEASISRITQAAGVAQGTFYNHFPNRQDLLDQLLPAVGIEMLEFIRRRVRHVVSRVEKEAARFRAFFDFLIEMPEFMRILNESDLFGRAKLSEPPFQLHERKGSFAAPTRLYGIPKALHDRPFCDREDASAAYGQTPQGDRTKKGSRRLSALAHHTGL